MARVRRPRTPQGPFELLIEDLSHEGVGVGHRDGKAVFVPDCLPGERIRYLSLKQRRDLDEGRLLEILEPSPQRVTPRCPHFGVCGGCSLQHLDPAAQIEFKQKQLLQALARIGKVEPLNLLPPLTGPLWGYRRRARLGLRHMPKQGGVQVGFRERDSAVLAQLRGCEVLAPVFGRRIEALAALVTGLDIRERVPQIEIAVGDDDVAVAVFRVLDPPGAADRARLRDFERSEGIRILLQPGAPDSASPLEGGMPPLHYRLPAHGVEIHFAPGDFIQVNAVVNAAMVDQALALLAPRPDDEVLELFCGLGNFSLPLARRARAVVAVEGERGLVERARGNARANGIGNVEFQLADLAKPDAADAWAGRRYDKALIDPPRAGAREVLELLAACRPGRLVYVSCHPGTLARDAGILVHALGYRLQAAGVMDMFPHTSHVESMALFERR